MTTSKRDLLFVRALGAAIWFAAALASGQETAPASRPEAVPETRPDSRPESRRGTLEETRLMMGRWIETQQIISKERKDWQQGKDVLVGRLDVVKQEVASLDDKIKKASAGMLEAEKKKADLAAERDQLKATGADLAKTVAAMEAEVRRLFKMMPDPFQTRVKPLYTRIPEDPEKAKVSLAERFQNVLGILNEMNKANNELTVSFEVHELANGKPSEVKVLYVGLAQAYYVSGGGEAGIGRPTADGWKWEANDAIARDVMRAFEVRDNKHSPVFVPLPVKLP
jgi:hypothetical protein